MIIALVLFFFSYALYYFVEQNITLEIENNLYEKAIFIKDSIEIKTPIESILNDKKLALLNVYILQNNELVNFKGNINFDILKPFLDKKDSFFILENDDIANGLYNLKLKKPIMGNIVIYEEGINNKAENIESVLWILEPILLLILIFLASKLIDKVLIPIKNITKIANELSVTDLSKSIDETKNEDEILELISSFNLMIKRIRGGVEKLDRFNNDVSHELRSPLTVIKGEIEIALKKIREPKYYINSMSTILYEANKMQKIVDDLLLLTKYTSENIQKSFSKFSLDTLLLDIIESYIYEIKKKNLRIDIKKLEPIDIFANDMLIRAMLSNILDNAIKYSKNDKKIYISLYKDSTINLIVEDEGIGVEKEHISKLTDKFYRVDESRNQQIQGFGLGLSIVKYATDLHNMRLEFKSVIGNGTTVKINF